MKYLLKLKNVIITFFDNQKYNTEIDNYVKLQHCWIL